MHKNYKQNNDTKSMQRRGVRGQIALFVIIAVVIVGALLFYLVYPSLPISASETENPASFLQSCIMPEVERTLPIISSQGGYYNPNFYTTNLGKNYTYLCYTNQPYELCVVQQPRVIHNFETELQKRIAPRARDCLAQLKASYESEGYRVTGSSSEVNVSLFPDKVVVSLIAPFEVSRETTQTFRTFAFEEKTKIYDLMMIATNIVQFESILGDSETTLYLQYYPDIKIEKLKKNGDTLYTVTDVVSKDSFSFAIRSLVWPEGYGPAGGTQ